MRIFEYPYIIITLLVFFFFVLGAIGIFFALQGVKAAKGTGKIDFSTVKKLENDYNKLSKQRKNKCLIYINVSLDNIRSLYSDTKAMQVFSGIKPIMLRFFHNEDEKIAIYDQKNFIVLGSFDENEAKQKMEQCLGQMNQYLLEHEAINIVHVRFGFFCTWANVPFDEAIMRAKKACTLAEHNDVAYAGWDSNNGKALDEKIKIENNIENEIDNNRFFLEYQPILEAEGKTIIGAEVLARLNATDGGVLSPGRFLSAVDSVGLNDKFDSYIFEKNCKWIANNKQSREKYLYTINFSRTTLCDPQFAQKVIDTAEKYQLKYSALAIEVLEDKNITGKARAQMIENIKKLKEKGVLILLDDFGSGFTTFGDLQHLDINIVKIDKSITQKSNTPNGLLIMKNIIRTAHELGLKTLCEGIETEEQEKTALSIGCDYLQGYYYYRPMPVAQLEALLETNGKF
ncbi:MAG: EAL domain-containing protein [Clostridia bacterium]|nr:EAL domain-containing protein [Clostridia bacterium]